MIDIRDKLILNPFKYHLMAISMNDELGRMDGEFHVCSNRNEVWPIEKCRTTNVACATINFPVVSSTVYVWHGEHSPTKTLARRYILGMIKNIEWFRYYFNSQMM